MKATDKTDEKKRKIKKKPIDKSKKQQVVVVAQEIKFARLLSGNEKKTRDRVLRALKKWLVNCFEKNYEFKEDDFTRVWKGLFYAVWMSDKPLVQEDLCESIAGILDLFPPEHLPSAMLLARAGFKMLATEWFGLDQHRIDKFLMLVRRYLRGALRCVHRSAWSEDACRHFADMLAHKDGVLALKTPVFARNAISMSLHIADCYLEEISKVSSGQIPPESICILMQPFISYMCHGAAQPLCVAARRVVADLLTHADVEEEDEVESDRNSDEENGNEAADADEASDDSDDDDEMTNGALDPRAGRVDVSLRTLPVPAASLAAALRRTLATAAGAGQRRGRACLKRLERLSAGEQPFPVPEPDVAAVGPLRPARAARALRALEKKLVANGDELALRGLSRKHRKRLLARSRAGHSIVEEVTNTNSRANGEWQVEDTAVKITKKKRKQADKETVAEPKNKRQKLDDKDKEKKDVNKVKLKKQKTKVTTEVNGIEKVKKIKHVKVNDKLGASVKSNNIVSVKVKSTNDKLNIDDKIGANVKSTTNDKSTVKVKNKIKVNKDVKQNKSAIKMKETKAARKDSEAKLLVKKLKKFQKQDKANSSLNGLATPKKVKFELKNNSMQGTLDYYKSVRQSPSIPFDSSKRPSKTNLKVSTPSPINPFFKKKMTRRASFAAQIVY